MAKSCILLFCGLPGVGKSYIAKIISERLLQDNKDVAATAKQYGEDNIEIHIVTMCYDSLVPNDLYREEGSNNSDVDRKCWKEERKLVTDFIAKFLEIHAEESRFSEAFLKKCFGGKDAIACKIDRKYGCACFNELENAKDRCCCRNTKHFIIIDDNMFYRSMRYEYYQIARKYGVGFLQLYITCDIKLLLQRNNCRAEPISNDTIFRMNSNFEIPDAKRNDWENNTVIIDTTCGEIKSKLINILGMVDYCFKNPVEALPEEDLEEKEETRNANLKSILHQADNVIRKLISSEIKRTKETRPRDLVTELNKRKKNFLSCLKTSYDVLQELEALRCIEFQSKTVETGKNEDSPLYNESLTKNINDCKKLSTSERRLNFNSPLENQCFEKAVKVLFMNYKEGELINEEIRFGNI